MKVCKFGGTSMATAQQIKRYVQLSQVILTGR